MVAGRVDVQYEVDAVHVDAAGGDVGGDQRVDEAFLEVRERPRTGALRHTAVQRVGLHTGLAQLLGDPVRAQLGTDEDDRAPVARRDGVGHRSLVARLHDEDVVAHRGDRALGRVHLVADRVDQVTLDEAVDLVLQRRGEEHPLAAFGHQVEQFGDLGQEAEVGHLVGLVEHRDLDVVQRAGAAVDQVTQPARSSDENVNSPLQRGDLVGHRGATADHLQLQTEHIAVGLERVGDLHGQLTGRGEDDGARTVPRSGATGEAGQRREAEAERLAGAGTAAAEDVLAGERVGDGGGLDGERGGDAVLCELAHDGLGETEGAERDLLGLLLRHARGVEKEKLVVLGQDGISGENRHT